MSLAAYQVVALNTATASENKIHDDSTAQRFGFKGGFVGGVNVYGYMSHQPLQRWGRAWLERGTGEARFGKPVYNDEVAEVTAVEDANGLELTVRSRDVLCATGRAAMPEKSPSAPPLSDYKSVPPRLHRAAADEHSLKVGDWLGMTPISMTGPRLVQDLQDLGETNPIYAADQIVHPGMVLRCCNWALSHNVLLPAWIHMGSTVQNLGIATVGDTLNIRARIIGNYERKGHKWVELDAMVVANEIKPIIRAVHVAIYQPRQVAAAA